MWLALKGIRGSLGTLFFAGENGMLYKPPDVVIMIPVLLFEK